MHHIDLDTITLTKGGHPTRSKGVCLMEAVAWWAGKPHTDHPECVSPVLATYGRNLNDALPDGKRQELIPLIPLLPGTAGHGRDETRSWLALDWLIRTYTPAWLDLAGLSARAEALRGLPRIADPARLESAMPAVRQAQAGASAALAAALATAGDAALATAGDAALAAGDATLAAGDATLAAAWAKLAPTVTQLQDSAISLYQQMITAGKEATMPGN